MNERAKRMGEVCAVLLAAAAVGCTSPEGKGLRATPEGTGSKIRFDMFHRPLPEIPLPNDLATRYDTSSPTKRRVNASLMAATEWEKTTRSDIDALDGWSTYGAITVGFDKPLDVEQIYNRHVGDDYDPRDDAVYVIDISPDSPDYCEAVPLDMGEGNFPLTLERRDYFPNDVHNVSQQLVFEEFEEDRNGNGALDLGEDLDMDGVLDHPNYRHPDSNPFDVMSFYERETNTLIMKPVMPMRENTTYAAVITRRLLDEDGRPVRSPFEYINHTAQTKQLEPLQGCLGKYNLGLEDIAFTWPFTTQSISRDFKVVRDGLYGQGVMQRLAAAYPADVKNLLNVRLPNAGGTNVNVKIVPGDYFWKTAKDLIITQAGGKVSPADQQAIDAHKFIDFHVVFTFESPQLFPRCATPEGQDAECPSKDKPENDANVVLPLEKQTWKLDPVSGEAFTRSETVTVWLTVPKNRKGPAPLVILGHGYTGTKLDPLFYGGFFARHGLASIGMENVSHGIGLPAADKEVAKALFKAPGLEPFFNALIDNHRATDQDGDGVADSGADFWTSLIFHTRDVVRQTAVDYMQLIRILRSFDGQKKWGDSHKANKDGLAGDFDGDGVIDVGGSASLNISGGSLGGIMSVMMGGLEPALDVAIPVSGGAGLADIGVRSVQGGVGEAVNLRMMGPLLITLKNTEGTLDLWQYVPNMNKLGKAMLAPLPLTPNEGDTAVVKNLRSGEYRCGRVMAGGLLRVAVSSDEKDPLLFEVYPGALPPQELQGCRIPEEAQPSIRIDTLGYDVTFQAKLHPKGEALTALQTGFGLRRNSAEIRRFMGLAQMAVDRGDPVNYAPNFEQRLLKYGTGEEVHTRVLVFNTIGDMNVPVATGAAIARAAGFIELRAKDPRYGKTQNRVLIDTGTLEAVERTGRWQNSKGQNVHMDLEHFSAITGADDKFDVPRLSPPLRLVKPSTRVGGKTGALFPMVVPTGRHGFDTPDPAQPFDLGSLILNVTGRYVSTGGRDLDFEPCHVNSSCAWIPVIPPDPQ
jgi:hypothetical protein